MTELLFFKYVSKAKAQCSMALSLARWALKDKFPTPIVPLTSVLPNHQVFLPDPVEQQLAYKM